MPSLATLAALLAVYVIWGSTYLAMRYALDDFTPAMMAGVRFTAAGAAMFAFLKARGAPWPTLRQWRGTLIVGVLLLVFGNALVAAAEQHVSSSVAAVMISTVPLWAALFQALFGQRPTVRELAAIVLGASGVIVLNLGGDLYANRASAALLVIAAASWALGSVLSPRLGLPAGPIASAMEMVCGGLILLLYGFVRGEHVPHAASTSSKLALGYLIVFGSLVAFSAYGYLLRTVRPALATSYAYVNPVVAVGLGVLLAHEKIAPTSVAGMGLVLVAVLLVALRRRPA